MNTFSEIEENEALHKMGKQKFTLGETLTNGFDELVEAGTVTRSID